MANFTKRQLDSLEKKASQIEAMHKEAIPLSKDIKTHHTKYTNIIKQLEDIKAKATKLSNEYNSAEKQIQGKLNKAEKFYDKTFLSLKEKIDDNQTGLRKAIQDAESFFRDIEKKKDKVKASNDAFSAKVKDLNAILAEAKKIANSTTTTSNKAKTNKEMAKFNKADIFRELCTRTCPLLEHFPETKRTFIDSTNIISTRSGTIFRTRNRIFTKY